MFHVEQFASEEGKGRPRRAFSVRAKPQSRRTREGATCCLGYFSLWLTLVNARSLDSMMQKPKSLFVALLMTLTAGLAIGTRAMAQEQSGKVIPNAIWVGADGKFESDPDTALVQFGVSAQEEKLRMRPRRPRRQPSKSGNFCAATDSIPRTRRSAASPRSRFTTTRIPSANWSAIAWTPTSASS